MDTEDGTATSPKDVDSVLFLGHVSSLCGDNVQCVFTTAILNVLEELCQVFLPLYLIVFSQWTSEPEHGSRLRLD